MQNICCSVSRIALEYIRKTEYEPLIRSYSWVMRHQSWHIVAPAVGATAW